MTAETLQKANSLTETIRDLKRAEDVIKCATKLNRDLEVVVENEIEGTLDTNNPYIRAAVSGMLTGLEIHREKCEKELAAL